MSSKEITNGLYELLAPYSFIGNGINMDEVDSFEFIQIILGIEEAYGIMFDDKMMDFEILKDIPVLAEYINEQLVTNS
jgi:hypothetical protein